MPEPEGKEMHFNYLTMSNCTQKTNGYGVYYRPLRAYAFLWEYGSTIWHYINVTEKLQCFLLLT
jgi:hypothetical protein